MSSESATAAARGPDIHVWMGEAEAAATLGTSESLLSCQIELGELETRITADGAREVLVGLPRRTAQPKTASNAAPAGRPERSRSPRASAAGWIVAVAVLLVACAAGVMATRIFMAARQQARELSAQVDQLSIAAASSAAERNQLAQQLSEARQAIAKAQGELAVERKIEDTLIQGALSARAKTAAARQPSQLADGAE